MSRRGTLPEKFKNFVPKFGPIGETVFLRTYSHKKEDGGLETWPDTTVRAVDGNLALVDPQFIEEGERDKLIELLLTFSDIPAGRHLNASGVKGRQYLFNCHAAGYDPAKPSLHFSFLFDELMQGGGVGSNYSNRYVESIPKIARSIDLHITCDESHPDLHEFEHLVSDHDGEQTNRYMKVDDSREGWIEAVELLCKLAFGEETPWNVTKDEKEVALTIDVSGIRRRGSPLITSGGIACGPGPLVSLLSDLVKQLNSSVGRRLSSLQVMIIDHILASCVIAGGKRRSSRMSVKSWKDWDIFEFINCKREDGAHWSTNISVEIDDEFLEAYGRGNDHAKRVARAIVLGKRLNGEPGVWNRSLAQQGERDPESMFCPNPCGEIGLYMWENCNLGHVNLEMFAGKPLEEMLEAFRLMARWLVRATFGDIPQAVQREVVSRNRRIGVGFMGYHAWLALHGIRYSDSWNDKWVRSVLGAAKAAVQEAATAYANQLDIPVPVKFTTLAPTGTVVTLPGTTSSGQAMMAPWFIRLVRFSDMDPRLAEEKAKGYRCFPDEDAKDTTIVEYWCEDPLVAKVRALGFDPDEVLEGQYDIDFETSLKTQAMFQEVYVDNAISFTIGLRPEDMPNEEDMEALLIRYLPHLKGTTVFPDRSRKNAPIQPLTREEFAAYTGRKQITMVEQECRGACPAK